MRHTCRALAVVALAPVAVAVTACVDEPEPESTCHHPSEIDAAATHHGYVIDRFDLPVSTGEATGVALDLDDNGSLDNQLGTTLSVVFQTARIDPDAEVKAMLDAGRLLHLVDVQAADLDGLGCAGVTLFHGVDLDADPADNFGGAEAFGIDAALGSGSVVGPIQWSRVRAAGGTLPLAVGLPGFDEELLVHLTAGRIEVETADAASGIDGIIAGGIVQAEMDSVVEPGIYRGLLRGVDRDCPDGVCVPDSFGALLLAVFDADEDGAISEQEFRDNTIARSLLQLDLDLVDADGNPGPDRVNDAMSFAIGFHAVPATIVD